jgi:hypothetical protein
VADSSGAHKGACFFSSWLKLVGVIKVLGVWLFGVYMVVCIWRGGRGTAAGAAWGGLTQGLLLAQGTFPGGPQVSMQCVHSEGPACRGLGQL